MLHHLMKNKGLTCKMLVAFAQNIVLHLLLRDAFAFGRAPDVSTLVCVACGFGSAFPCSHVVIIKGLHHSSLLK